MKLNLIKQLRSNRYLNISLNEQFCFPNSPFYEPINHPIANYSSTNSSPILHRNLSVVTEFVKFPIETTPSSCETSHKNSKIVYFALPN